MKDFFINFVSAIPPCSSANTLEVHPSDCTKYVMCDSQRHPIAVYECPHSLTFNSAAGVCDESYTINCGFAGVTESTTTSEQASTTNTAGGNEHLSFKFIFSITFLF